MELLTTFIQTSITQGYFSTALMLEPNQKLKLVKDSYAGDYYVLES